jgi:ADP-ribose pyrophosphatase
MYIFYFLTVVCSTLFATVDPNHKKYVIFLEEIGKALGPIGDSKKGEIEIIKDPSRIKEIEDNQYKKFLKRGLSEEDAYISSRAGIITEDVYWIWVRDAVLFSSGSTGMYNRIIKKGALNGPQTVAVLPLLEDGRIVLNVNFRHATRSWELELPRGWCAKGEPAEDAAARKLREETGLILNQKTLLGIMATDTGCESNLVPVFLGRISKAGLNELECCKKILCIKVFTLEEVKEGLKKGVIQVEIGGKKEDVPIRDPYLTFALYQADLNKLI